MMRQMREATKPIMLVTAFAFVGLMVFTWGMDITGQSSGAFGEIGSVNREAVMYDSYMAAYRNLYEQVQAGQEAPVTSQQNKEIEDAAFDEVVNQLLIRQELRRRGIGVTDQEISQAAQLSPPGDLRPQFTTAEGQFDFNGYQTFLATLPPDQLLLLEAYYRDVIPRGKLLRQVSTGIYQSDAELWQRFRDQNEQAEIRFLALDPGTRFEDSEFEITDAEINAYYRDNQEEFEMPAQANVKVIVLDKTPTPADTVASAEKASAIRQELVDGADFAEVATRESADLGSAALGGDLGTFPKGRMAGAFDSTVFSAPLGTVTEPVKTSFGYHVIEVMERWGQDSAQARHVLVPIARTDDSEIALLMRADSLEDLGESLGLDAVGSTANVDVQTVDISQNFPFVMVVGQISEGSDWVFEEASPGDVSPVFETTQGFYMLELLSSEPAGVLPIESASPAIESTLVFEKKMARAQVDGLAAVARIRGGETLDDVAASLGLDVSEPVPFSRNDFVPGMGRQNAAVGAAFGLQLGSISDVVSTRGNVFILESIGYAPADSAFWLGQRVQQRQTQVAIMQQQRLQEWIEALRTAARIIDRRDVVLAPQDETAMQMPMVF
jgi:parvulin-like peptidyl-prolyl isomerase